VAVQSAAGLGLKEVPRMGSGGHLCSPAFSTKLPFIPRSL
jgi:hypothetical protein